MDNWEKFIREVQTRKPLTFKYFKVWEKLTGYSEEGDGEEEYEEVKREEISKEEYEKNKVKY
jgi:hypothetical protein|tara:strand:+ start:331 stop:516 length:186 start_codon:yes stop_codon:yes gene_type:complete